MICTNRQALDVVLSAPQTMEALRGINGIGKKKAQWYGKDLIAIVREFFGPSDA